MMLALRPDLIRYVDARIVICYYTYILSHPKIRFNNKYLYLAKNWNLENKGNS